MSTPFPRLFSPLRLGARTARNRIVSTPHDTGFGVDGYPQEQWLRYEREKAKGGAGVLMMFGTASVHPSSPFGGQGGVEWWRPEVIPHLQRLADAVHAYDTLCIAQLSHWGRAGSLRAYADHPIYAPDDDPDEVHHGFPRAVSPGQIHELVDHYALAATHVQRGGYDGVDLQYTTSSLPGQFLSPASNTRADEYGGSLENRMRFPLAIVGAIRSAVGRDFVVGIRLIADQFTEGGLTLDDVKEIAARFAATGKLDYLTITISSVEQYHHLPYVTPTYYAPLGLSNSHAAAIREVVGIPVIVAGRIVHPSQAEAVLANGWADAVAMTRSLIADPEMPRKAMEGRVEEIRLCTGASEACLGRRVQGRPMACIQNPTIGREAELADVTPAERPRIVVVAGGGVAGLEAARMAAVRGHRVTLFERSGELGGQLLALARVPMRETYRSVVTWLANQAEKAGVEIRLNAEATVDAVLAERPDAVIVATGGRQRKIDAPAAPDADVAAAERRRVPGRPRPAGRDRQPLLHRRRGHRRATEGLRLPAIAGEGRQADAAGGGQGDRPRLGAAGEHVDRAGMDGRGRHRGCGRRLAVERRALPRAGGPRARSPRRRRRAGAPLHPRRHPDGHARGAGDLSARRRTANRQDAKIARRGGEKDARTIETLDVARRTAESLRQRGEHEGARAIEALVEAAREEAVPSLDLLTTTQAGDLLGVTGQTIKNWVREGRLAGFRVGGRIMIPREVVVEYVRHAQASLELDAISDTEAARLVAEGRQIP